MKRLAHSLSIGCTLWFAACGSSSSSNHDAAAIGKVSLASGLVGNETVELLTDVKLETGLVPIYLKITDATGLPVTDATVTLVPMMSMSTGASHTCPVLLPPTLGADGLYRAEFVFQMASTDVDTWSATVDVTRPGADTAEAVLPLPAVPDSGRTKAFTFTDLTTATDTRYVASLNFVKQPKVGLNPIIVTLHTRQDMMTFPPVDDAQMALDPEMPSMGHGSPGSSDPILTSTGRYEGQLSFSMAGEWETTVTISRVSVTVGMPVFTTNF